VVLRKQNAHKVVDVKARTAEQGLIPPLATPAATPVSSTIAAPAAKEQVLRLAEEQLDVGKRMVQEGTTRIRRFVTGKPVEAKVTLHEEHAQVVRRAISDPKYVQGPPLLSGSQPSLFRVYTETPGGMNA
jgi:stress response protein YsnF